MAKVLIQGSTFQTVEGQMFFGGRGGLNVFYPEAIRKNEYIPPVVLTDFELANQSVEVGEDSVLDEIVDATDAIILPYQDKVLTFQFAALNYVSPEKNQYAYKMEGFEDDWTIIDSSSREARYTNLDAGDYTFKVKASNNDGVWNEEGKSINITILPPWWETTWFQIGLGLLAVGLLVGGYRWRVSSLQARSRELEAQIRSLFENSPMGITLSSFDGKFLVANKAFLQMLCISEEEILQRSVTDFYSDPSDRAALLAGVQESGAVRDFGVQLVRNDGSSFFASLNMSRLVLEGNEVLLVMVEDVTVQIAAEQESAVIKERDRLAQELHDAVTQTLFSASLLADTAPRIWDKDQAIARQNLAQVGWLLRGALAEMRTLLFELRPAAMENQTLGQLLDLLVETARARTRAIVHLTVEDDRLLPENVTTTLFRIAQESLNNVAKHAEATEVNVSLVFDPQGIVLRIADDGRGFDLADIPPGHLGIGIMSERARTIGAIFEIESNPGGGTQVVVTWSDQEERIAYD